MFGSTHYYAEDGGWGRGGSPDVSAVAAAALAAVLAVGVERAVAGTLAQLAGVAAVARVAGLGVRLVERLHDRQRRRHDLAQRHRVVRFRAAQQLCQCKPTVSVRVPRPFTHVCGASRFSKPELDTHRE